MKHALVIMQVAHEGLGRIEGPMNSAGIRATIIRAYLGETVPCTIGGFSALIVLGGPMGVYDEAEYPFLASELKLIKDALSRRVPVLGICLGAQLMACAAGASVYPGEKKEIGWYRLDLTEAGKRDALLSWLPPAPTVFQWHGDTFDIPPGAVRLASSALFPNQLFSINNNSYALQLHLEVTEAMVTEWIEVNACELATLTGEIDPEAIANENQKYIGALRSFGHTVFSRFFRGVSRQ